MRRDEDGRLPLRDVATGRRVLLSGLNSVEDIRRVLKIAMFDAVGLENSVARGRLLLGIVTAAARLLEVDQFGAFSYEDER